ncbi:MAG: asparagine synthase (glutamine-hydrolyzing) [Patescibacteria group bacterium]
MCGINGFTFSDPDRLRLMHAVTKHRGPDDEGFFETDGISLAHNRLSIIDLSPGGHQPMTSSDGRYTIVFNGEIYNYRELKALLEGMGTQFRTSSDTEVLLAAFACWGEECFKKMNGIFALAIWDRDERKLTVARDHIGVKPLYYHWDGSRFSFSSELKALFVHDLSREIDRDALQLYFRLLYVPGPRTMFASIKKLQPGHIATIQNGTLTIRQYWQLHEGTPFSSYREGVEAVREGVKRAVSRQLVSDRPLGVFLSGGIDSTAILGVMRGMTNSTIKTFTVGYDTDVQSERYNADADLAAKTATTFGTEHHTFKLSAHEAMEHLQEIAFHMDEPIANHIQSSTFLLARLAKPEITVALGGDGGDELFGGYPRYWWSTQIDRIQRLPLMKNRHVMSFLVGTVLGKPQDLPKFLSRPGIDRHLAFIAQKEEAIRRIVKPGVIQGDMLRETFAPLFEPAWKDATNQLMATDIATWLPDESLIRTDKLTMASALEERVPLLDPELVELAFRIPSAWKLGTKKQGKRIFIDAMRPFLPDHILREEKRAWLSPMAKWIRGPLLPFMREVLSPSYNPETVAYLDFEGLGQMLTDHVEHRRYALNELWAAVSFQLWYKAFSRL